MKILMLLIDYDNVPQAIARSGPISLAKILTGLIPRNVLIRYDTLRVRLYGGWRINGTLTRFAQGMVPYLHAGSPTIYSVSHEAINKKLRFSVELADGPIGGGGVLEETLALNRDLRKFRARTSSLPECASPGVGCGFHSFMSLNHNSTCGASGCSGRLGDVFVRDEQKMVDTLLVADIAQVCLVNKASDVVVVSSDADIWPGIMLAISGGCNVIHLHPQARWRTQKHLLRTLPAHGKKLYQQFCL